MLAKKYILVKEIYAKTPFEDCHLRFVITKRHNNQPNNSQIEFSPRPISAQPQEYLEFNYSTKDPQQLALFVLAVSSNNRVANIGCLPLSTDETMWQKKEYLKGIIEQNGFIIYSTRDQPFPQRPSLGTSEQKQSQQKEEKSSVGSFKIQDLQADQTPFKKIQNASQMKPDLEVLAQTESPFDFSASIRSQPAFPTNKIDFSQSKARKNQGRQDNRSDVFGRKEGRSFNKNLNRDMLKEHKLKNSHYFQNLKETEVELELQRKKLQSLGIDI